MQDKIISYCSHMKNKENHFEHGNKSGNFLVNQLKLNKDKTAIPDIKDSAGTITHDPQINKCFKDFL